MKPFFGRAQELSELDATARLPGAKFIVIKGRRRVGKSRLAQEFGKRHPDMALYYLTGLPPSDPPAAQRERENFASQLSRVFKIPKPTSDNWDELLWHLADRVKSGNAILVLDEINWIGHADRKFSSKLWALWETELSGLSNFILILSGSLAGWIDDQFSSHTGYLGRISWNTTLDELPLRDALLFFGVRRARISIYEQLTILLITGGIPRYLEEIDPRQTAEENIKRLCFSQAGLLFNEYDQLMNDLFQGRNKIYRDIIEALTEHPLTLNELNAAISKQKSGVMSAYVEDLEKSGFLMRHHAWNPRTGRLSNRYKIRIIDNYVRFYLKAIRPAAGRIKAGLDTLPASLYGVLGLQFENLVLKNKRLLLSALGVRLEEIVREGPYFQNHTTKHAGCQIDYLIQTRHSLFVVEVKFSKSELTSAVVQEVRRKVAALITPRNLSIRPVLVHVNGVAEGVESADYFDRVVDFGALARGDVGSAAGL
jgi:AAA+ ATPase superfamily predicted ATPase